MNAVELKSFLQSTNQVSIVCHQNPDGDAIGSSMGLKHLLENSGMKAQVIVPNDFPDFLKYLEGNDSIINAEQKMDEASALIENSEVVFMLDFNTIRRCGPIGSVIEEHDSKKVLIDHHLQPDVQVDFMLSDTSASSTAQLVYEFADQVDLLKHLDKKVADSLYMGILTDTGKFSFSVSPKVHRIVADLLEAGADVEFANDKIFNSHTESRLRFWGYSLSRKMKVYKEYKTALIALSTSDMHRFNVRKGDMEGLVNQGLSISNVNMSVLMKEDQGKIKFSFRSKGELSVNEIARAHFNGGGHRNASGGRLDCSLEEAIAKFESVLPEYKEALNQ